MPGFNLYYNSVIRSALYGDNQDNRLAAQKELDEIHKRYPDTAYENFKDLPIPQEPMRFYIDDLTDCEFYASS